MTDTEEHYLAGRQDERTAILNLIKDSKAYLIDPELIGTLIAVIKREVEA